MLSNRAALLAVAVGLISSAIHAGAVGSVGFDTNGQPKAQTNLGLVRGTLCGDDNIGNASVAAFLGIPYARPPLGRLRFAAPVAWTSNYNGLNATKPGPQCMQQGQGEMSEDCLFLNVWAPVNATAPLPVRVFIHGGGYQGGSGTEGSYDGCALVRDGSTIVVTLNYRLGVLGFLARPGLADPAAGNATGNWGLLDQRAALKWIQTHIASFGGDPTRVVLTGESAGAYSSLLHVVAPGSAGLFSSVVSFSGSTDVMSVDFPADAYRKGEVIKQLLDCDGRKPYRSNFTTAKQCLQLAPLDRIMKAQETLGTATIWNCIPVIDGVVIPKHPNTLLKEGRANNVSVLLNSNNREGFAEVFGGTAGSIDITKEKFLEVVNDLVPVPPELESWFLAQYDASQWGGSWFLSAVFAVTDGGYQCPARRVAQLLAESGVPARYSILQASKPNSGCPFVFNFGFYAGPEFTAIADSFHGYDIFFSFLLPHRSPYKDVCNFTQDEANLSSFVSGIVAAMAYRGAPFPPMSKTLVPLAGTEGAEWPAWSNTSRPFLNIDSVAPEFLDADVMQAPKCAFWDALLQRDIAAGTILENWPASPPPPVQKPPKKQPAPTSG